MSTVVGLLDTLSVQVVLVRVCSHLPLLSILQLAAVSKSLQSVVYDCPVVFRRIDVSQWKRQLGTKRRIDKAAQSAIGSSSRDEQELWRVRALLQSLAGRSLLAQLQILVLDGQKIDLALLQDVLLAAAAPLRILSIVRSTSVGPFRVLPFLESIYHARPRGTKATLGVYVAGVLPASISDSCSELPSTPKGVTTSLGATLGVANDLSGAAAVPSTDQSQHPWYRNSGILSRYAHNLHSLFHLENLYLDVVRCRGPGHAGAQLQTARVALRGCQTCGGAPEGLVDPATAPSHDLPLLQPVPHSPSIRLAQQPYPEAAGVPLPRFLARCLPCLGDRWCVRCGRFWCENCYDPKIAQAEDDHTPVSDSESARVPLKVYNGLCVEKCLVAEMYHGAGSGGMWG